MPPSEYHNEARTTQDWGLGKHQLMTRITVMTGIVPDMTRNRQLSRCQGAVYIPLPGDYIIVKIRAGSNSLAIERRLPRKAMSDCMLVVE